ncbi:MAG: RelA/SpoT family protein [Paludibacteraceae bacterium]|nr:RelA/SpoT family protein [Paludibacteraceae bacterium]
MTEQEEEKLIQDEFDALLQDYANTAHKQKVGIITKAFQFAKHAHHGVKRRSGEPYIMHPLAVARIVVNEIGLGSTSICSALLHDVVEDTDYTLDDIEKAFNPKIASIVDGLTKISGGIFGDGASAQAENFRKLILTMPEDIRVILIKMADRLHNMRTLGSMAPAKQLKICGETLYIYAPLAQRLGFFKIKTEFENLCFRYEHPQTYLRIEEQLRSITPKLDDTFRNFTAPIERILHQYGIRYTMVSRIKSPYSVFHKMQAKNITFDEVYDLLAVRIILEPDSPIREKSDCWLTYAAITNIYKPHPDRTRDWINTPKTNGYEALHVTVMGPGGNWIEVQIRSRRMNDIAERGIAAHWKYKTGEHEESDLDHWFASIKEMLDTSDFTNAVEFMDTFKLNLYASELFVFTPAGDVRKMPTRSTVLDFAFSLHSELGFHCIGAKVDHRLVPSSYELHSGEQVEVLTSNSQQPLIEWLDFCTTSKAKAQLRTYLKSEIKEKTDAGQRLVGEILMKAKQRINSDSIQVLTAHYGFRSKEDLYYNVGAGKIDISDAPLLFATRKTGMWARFWRLQFGGGNKTPEQIHRTIDPKKDKSIDLTDSELGTTYQIAPCCNPIPGDQVLGFVDDRGTVIVHRLDCPEAEKLKASFGHRIITAAWKTQKVLSFRATISIKGFDRPGLLKEIVHIISDDYNINMRRSVFETNDRIFSGTIEMYVFSADDINNLCHKLMELKPLKEVKRID